MFSPKPVILMYHSIQEHSPKHDVFGLRVSLRNFSNQIEFISHERTPLPLDEFVNLMESGTLPFDAAAVTFDDGYADNLLIAKPVLDRYSVPATLFLATGLIGESEFWWDRLERMILESATPIHEIGILLDNSGFALDSDAGLLHRGAFFTILHKKLLNAPTQVREGVIDHLANKIQPRASDDIRRPLTEAEVRSLANDGLTSIGAHTVTHPWLPNLNPSELMSELSESKRVCEDLFGRPSCSFAYPFGAYDDDTREAVKAAGFTLACATIASPMLESSNRFALPRIQVKDWTADQLAQVMGHR